MSDLKGKVAIVTGGGGVLGGNISGSLVKAGVNVVILDIVRKTSTGEWAGTLPLRGDRRIYL